jgi:phospholipase C
MWGVKYIGSSGWLAEFLERAAVGTLPAVSFVDPIYTVLDDGTGNDDHPHADIRNGDAFLAAVFHAVAGGPAWDKTGLIINFDEWGGFFEHVAPPRVTAPNHVDSNEVTGRVLLGFRVPTVVVSPSTRNAAGTPEVNHTVFDHHFGVEADRVALGRAAPNGPRRLAVNRQLRNGTQLLRAECFGSDSAAAEASNARSLF